MKKFKLVALLVCLTLGLLGCQGQAENIERITLYDLQNSPDTLVIDGAESIKMIIEAINNAKEVAGIANMADPEYRMALGEQAFFLWLDEKSGTIMNTEDAHTIYSLTENSIKQMNELLEDL